MTDDEKTGLGVALDEATLLGIELDPARRVAAVTLGVFTLPEIGPAPTDPRIQLVLSPLGRVAASLRNARWDDPNASAVPFTPDELLKVSQSFGCLPIYGGSFFDLPEEGFDRWGNRLSLDLRLGADGIAHSMTMFQENGKRILDVRLWFEELKINGPQGNALSISDVIAGGRQWWDGLYAGDPRTHGYGIFPFRPEKT